jgi:hypothetical protein
VIYGGGAQAYLDYRDRSGYLWDLGNGWMHSGAIQKMKWPTLVITKVLDWIAMAVGLLVIALVIAGLLPFFIALSPALLVLWALERIDRRDL